MTAEQKLLLWLPLAALWLATFALRVVPGLRERVSTPGARRAVTAVGWLALVGIVGVLWGL